MLFDSKLMLQIRSNCFITYFQNNYHTTLTEEQKQRILEALKASREKSYSGTFTPHARKRLSRVIDLLIQIIQPKSIYNTVTQKSFKHRLSFITLTIPDQTDMTGEELYKKLFVHFIQWLRRTKKVKTYIWKIEVQKRGTIHYHITTTAFIHYQEIRDKWNNLLRQNDLMKNYTEKYQGYNPNSTDIHEVQHISDLSSYLKKEFCKSIQNPTTKGKIWDCSYNLKSTKYFNVEYDKPMVDYLLKLSQQKKVEIITLDQCEVIKCNPIHYENFLSLQQLLEYDIWKLSVKEKLN